MLTTEFFRDYLFDECGVQPQDKLCVGVSGGVDSVVLCHLLHNNRIPFCMVHVNYKLRDADSDADEVFVSLLAKKFDVPFFSKNCSKKDFTETGNNSTQAAARKIRYSFFDSILKRENYSIIATAHHLDDAIETALLNFARGTGVAGLRSILPRNENIIRPLLFSNRSEILKYAEENKIEWREDRTNATDNYARNRFRHHLLPWLMSEIPQGYGGFETSFSKLLDIEKLISATMTHWEKTCCEFIAGETRISIDALNRFQHPELFLKFFLVQNGFSDTQFKKLEALLGGESGLQIHADKYDLIRDRNYLILSEKVTAKNQPKQVFFDFKEESFDGEIVADNFSAMVDAAKVKLPFQIRKWQSGDNLIPLGMDGHKNVSDILNELKIPVHKKDKFEIVLSDDEIVWIPGYRIAEKFKVTKKTSSVIKLIYHP